MKIKIIESGISLFTVCRNRDSHLINMIKSVIDYEQINEIVIVDWSSDKSLRPILADFQKKKIVLAEKQVLKKI